MTQHWTSDDVKALVAELPELLSMTKPGPRAALICQHQVRILGADKERSRNSLHMSLLPGKRLLRQLDAIAQAPTEPEPEVKVAEPKTRRAVVRLRMAEWTALAHHPLVKPLLDKKHFCTPNQLIAVMERAQRDVLPEDRWRDEPQWHSAIYRASRGEDGHKRDALSMLREGIRFQPLSKYVMKEAQPEPTPTETTPTPSTQETTAMAPNNAFLSWNPTSDAALMQAFVQLFSALQVRTEAITQPLMERLAQLEAQVRAIPENVRAQVADVVGGPAPVDHAHDDMVGLPVFTPERLPRVDVVGLLGSQADVVKRACGNQWSLRFLSAEEVERQPITAPDAIMLRKFVSHSAQERIKKAGAKLHYANGAADSVIAQLNSLAVARMN